MDGKARFIATWVLLALWLVAFAATQFGAGPAAGGVQTLVLIAWVAVHASLAYGWKGFGVFFAISLAVAFAMEASSIHTGFPFGFYAHGDFMGPKLLGVPPPVALGYVFLGYLAWSLARLLMRDRPTGLAPLYAFTTPIAATFILAGYDLAYDPIGSTVMGHWAFRHPGGYFGVPLTNFLGWLLTGWVFLQLFALVERRFVPTAPAFTRGFWLQPCLIWGATALQYPLMFARAPDGLATVGGRSFVIADVYESAVIVSLLTMLFAALAAAGRLAAMNFKERMS